MTTYYHTPIAYGASLDSQALNRQLGDLDFAIRKLGYWELDWRSIDAQPATPASGYAYVYTRNGLFIVLGDDGRERALHWRDQYACILDLKTSSDGGTFTSGDWRTRDLNTVLNDPFGIVTDLSSNQITLNAGIYRVRASAPAYLVNNHLARLQDVTNATTLLVSNTPTASNGQIRAYMAGQFELTGQVTLELQHYAATTRATDGFGVGNAFTDSIFSVVELWRL